MTVRICSHQRLLLPMQSDVLNEQQQQQQQLSNDTDSSPSLSTTTLIYSGLKLHPKPLLPTISMPGVASPLSIVKKLSIPDSHLDNRHSSTPTTTNSTTSTTTPSSIRLITPTGKSSPPFQITDKTSTTNGTFPTSKTYILNHQQNSTTTVTKSSNSSSSSSSLLTLIPPGTTSPKIQTLNSVTISSTNDMSTVDPKSTINNPNQSVFLSKNRVTLVQPLITNSNSSTTNTNSSKLVTTNNNFWHHSQPQQTTQATKIFSIPTAKMLSRPVQLIPTTTSDHHPHITHIQTVKTEKPDTYPISMHIGVSSPTTNENPIKNFDTSTHPAFIHMQLLPTSNTDSMNTSQQSVQFTLPTTHLYSSPSSVLISTTQRSMDHNNNHQSTNITTPIIREMQIDEKTQDSTTNKILHSTKNRARLPLQPSTLQTSSPSTSMIPSSSTTTTPSAIRQPKKHKLNEDEQISSSEPPKKFAHYEQFPSSRNRPISKLSIENTTPNETTGCPTKKRNSAETANQAILSRKRRNINKFNRPNENHKHDSSANTNHSTTDINIEQIDDELLKRLSQDFVYTDKNTGLRWIATKTRSKSMSNLVSRFSWKPKINHYEKYSDIIRTNPKRTVPVKTLESIRQQLTEPWSSWRIDQLTTYLSDLTHDEQMTINELTDLTRSLDVNDQLTRTTIEDLIQANIQRHRCFSEQLTQISDVLVSLLEHGNTIRDLSKCSTTKRTKDR